MIHEDSIPSSRRSLADRLTRARGRRHTPNTVRSLSTSRALVTTAILAVAVVGLLPVGHVHGGDDATVVHRHIIASSSDHHDEGFEQHEASLGHDDHVAARVLSLAYDTTAVFAMSPSPAVATRFFDAAGIPFVSHARRATLLPTHDPPLRFCSSPAPPGLL